MISLCCGRIHDVGNGIRTLLINTCFHSRLYHAKPCTMLLFLTQNWATTMCPKFKPPCSVRHQHGGVQMKLAGKIYIYSTYFRNLRKSRNVESQYGYNVYSPFVVLLEYCSNHIHLHITRLILPIEFA